MSVAHDLFPGFETHAIEVPGALIHARSGGSGPPLLLLHGYPQTHVCWHRIAPALARHFNLVVADLRGYGESIGPEDDATHAPYSKRVMAGDCVALMRALGYDRFAVVGHDRGARVAYRLALDHPGRVRCLAVLDILTTHDAWADIDRGSAVSRFHWGFLARPAPFPETMIGHDPGYFLDYLLSSWTGSQDLSAFDPAALAHYRMAFARKTVIAATCADYRAGATIDAVVDAADLAAGRRIEMPVLALWGESRKGGLVDETLGRWRRWADRVEGGPVVSGHFLPEEAPEETLERLRPFLLAHGMEVPSGSHG